MISAGIRELRNHFSEYIQKVEEGETIRVTRYGKEIARLSPAEKSVPEELSDRLSQEGISWSGGRPKGMEDTVHLQGSPVADAVLEDRR